MFELRLLGPLELRATDGRDVEPLVRRSKRTGLLAYLAAALPRGFHRRDKLLALFWPELDEPHARAALSQALYVLRNALDEPAVVTRGDGEVGLSAEVVWCDVTAFEAALDGGRPAEALALYRGDLLDGFFITGAPEFERWLDAERARLRRRASEGAWALAEAKAAAGDAVEAERWARRAGELLPDDEAVIRRLMTFLHRLGDKAAAVRAYEAFAWRLAQEYEVEPSAETQALAATIRSEKPRPVAPRSAEPLATSPSAIPLARRRISAGWLTGVTVAALAALGTLGLLVARSSGGSSVQGWFRPGPHGPVSRYSIALPDTAALAPAENNLHYRIAISPDGERLVYVGKSADGDTRLWAWRRDQLHATPLAGTEGAINPFFSPDGSRVGFVSTGAPPAVNIVSLGGGLPITVSDSAVDTAGAAWGYDGYIYFDAHLEGEGIARVGETGGMPEPVTVADRAKREQFHFQPAPLPNGKGVLFVIWRGGGVREADVAVADLKTRVHRVLVRGVSPRYAASGHLLYATADGALMAAPFDQDKLALAGEPVAVVEGVGPIRGWGMQDLALSASGTLVYTARPAVPRELVWVARDGKVTAVDTTWRAVFTSLALSPDGAALAVGVQEGSDTHVWIKRLDQRPASKLTFEGRFNDRPAWTADGQAVAFVSGSRPSWDLYLRPVDGSALPRLLRDESGYLNEVEFSPDGKWLVYRLEWDLFAARTDGDGTRTPLLVTPGGTLTPRVSPDGRWLAYSSRESERREVYVRPFPNTGSAKWQVSIGGGMEPVWSRSGRELFYKNGHSELVAASLLPGATFAVGEQRVLFSTAEYVNYPAWRTYDVSPDGRRFVMMRPTREPREELILVENSFQELKAKVKRRPAR